MKTLSKSFKPAFSLIETVIAIGVLAVLLTGFMIVFAPAAAGIKKSISVQEADRLASTLEQELVTWRTGIPEKTGFEKAFTWLKSSNTANDALLIYQYRGSLSSNRPDGTREPVVDAASNVPGKDYAVVSIVRRKSDSEFKKDLDAVEGGVYLVKCTQLVFNNGELKAGTAGKIVDPKNSGTESASADVYPEAVIAFSAEFYSLPGKRPGYFDKAFGDNFTKFKNPMFTRNLAVRR